MCSGIISNLQWIFLYKCDWWDINKKSVEIHLPMIFKTKITQNFISFRDALLVYVPKYFSQFISITAITICNKHTFQTLLYILCLCTVFVLSFGITENHIGYDNFLKDQSCADLVYLAFFSRESFEDTLTLNTNMVEIHVQTWYVL